MCNGASDRARTGDPRFTRAVLYQLSYAGGHVVTQLRRQRLFMIRDIAHPRKGSDGFVPQLNVLPVNETVVDT